MKTRAFMIDVLGSLLFLSVIYHSRGGNLPLIVVPFIIIVSIGEHFEHEHLKLSGLVIFSLLIPYTVKTGNMDEAVPIILFVFTLALPLIYYWRSVLSPITGLEPWATSASVVYFGSVFVIFYLLIILLGVDEYLLNVTNLAPQSLVLIASSILAFVVVYTIGVLKYS